MTTKVTIREGKAAVFAAVDLLDILSVLLPCLIVHSRRGVQPIHHRPIHVTPRPTRVKPPDGHYEFTCVAKAQRVRTEKEHWLVLTRSQLAGFNPIRDIETKGGYFGD